MLVLLLKPKVEKSKLIAYSAIYLGLIIAFMELTATVVIWLWIPCMLIAFAMMAAFIYFIAKTDYRESVYYAVLAFSAAETVASIEWQIVNYVYKDVSSMPIWAEIIFLILIYGLFTFTIYQILGRRMPLSKKLVISKGDWFTALFIGIIVFGFSNLRFITDGAEYGQYSREIASARTMIDIAGVAVLYAHYLSIHNNAVMQELAAVQKTLQTQYQQYKQSRESIELINMRYHDMKHQIRYLRGEQDANKRDEFLNKMENEIKSFELQNKTGNAVLDTILTGRSLYCYKHGITMTSVADGKLLDFMEVVDICNIFGNALENAIESVLTIEDKEKRLIHVTVSQVNDFVMIKIENYYEGDLKTEEGEYLTTKLDKKYHGYGIKSIKYTADRYDGAVYINTENNWFDMKILIPIKKSDGEVKPQDKSI
jgi:sensor histidine kinase regulating citrate/malate metabolism